MKNFDSRTYSINDFVEWDAQKALVLNPRFQRRAVWSEKAKSYLMDTILRGKPIPKIFMRQNINVTTKSSVREVVDGQQRLRAILSYIQDGFAVTKRHHSEYGGLLFSQLPELVQEQILSYEVAVDLLINLPDSEILDIFGRLNSYAVVLNDQEKINATHFSEFKILADKIGYKYNEFWIQQKLISQRDILRMQEVALVADILIAITEGIKPKKSVRRYYTIYEKNFYHNIESLEERFDNVIATILRMFPDGLSDTEFVRIHLFYSLFISVYHCIYGIKDLDAQQLDLSITNPLDKFRHRLERVSEIFSASDVTDLSQKEREFINDSRRATTDEPVRKRRSQFLIALMAQ